MKEGVKMKLPKKLQHKTRTMASTQYGLQQWLSKVIAENCDQTLVLDFLAPQASAAGTFLGLPAIPGADDTSKSILSTLQHDMPTYVSTLKRAMVFDKNASIQITVDLEAADGGLLPNTAKSQCELNLFCKCTVEQVIAMVLRRMRLGTSTVLYELYVHNRGGLRASSEHGSDLAMLPRSTQIGQLDHAFFVLRQMDTEGKHATSAAITNQGRSGGNLDWYGLEHTGSHEVATEVGLATVPAVAVEDMVGTDAAACGIYGERMDFGRVTPSKIGALEKQTDHTKVVTMEPDQINQVAETMTTTDATGADRKLARPVDDNESPKIATRPAPAEQPMQPGRVLSDEDFWRWGITLEGLKDFKRQCGEIDPATKTSEVCHRMIKPVCVPADWEDIVEELVEGDPGWTTEETRYKHSYRQKTQENLFRRSIRRGRSWPKIAAALPLQSFRATTSSDSVLSDSSMTNDSENDVELTCKIPPPNTRSLCEVMLANPATAHYVGTPTVFMSHAWQFSFNKVLAAMENYVQRKHAEERMRQHEAGERKHHAKADVFFWFDCASIDEHATQTRDLDWWSTTFKDAIRDIGCVVMMFEPWHAPLPLKRGWCLWELFCAEQVGATFDLCFDDLQQKQLSELLMAGQVQYLHNILRQLVRIFCFLPDQLSVV
jgi:hypothetical protein